MRIVVKVGTSTLTDGTRHLNRQRVLGVVEQIAWAHQQNHEMILVSSGAQAAGRERLSFPDLGKSMPAKQMLSAVGQGRLMAIYSDLFDIFEIVVAQILLTRDDFSHRTRYLNARDTLSILLDRRILPIINENDTIATEEIRVGDNDNLSALVASAVEADLLVMLTDQPGLFTADPRKDATARLIEKVEEIDESMIASAGGTGTIVGTGGMLTKLQAAKTAARSGVTTIITSGKEAKVLEKIIDGENVGTRFEPTSTHLESRKRWLLTDRPQGIVHVDAGAAKVLLKGGASLLPVGIRAVERTFERGATLSVMAPDEREIAHGLSNYHSDDVRKLCGAKSDRIIEILGYSYGDSVIHRNNLVLLG